MAKILRGLAGVIVLALIGFGAVLAFDSPAKPPPLASVSAPFAKVDFSDLPPMHLYAARDGTKLGYRIYDGDHTKAVILIHGSSDDGAGAHPLAKALRDSGASVYVPSLRGHGGFGRSGDIDHIGQLEEDLADLVAVLRPARPDASLTLIGFSSGGGFVLRVIGGADEKLFDRFIMISPALPHGAPTLRPDTGGWVAIALPRIIALTILNRAGIDWFNGLPIVAFGTDPDVKTLTGIYSFRLAVDFGASSDYLAAFGRSTKPAALLVGDSDELFYADRFAPLLQPVRPDLRISMVPGIGHIGMSISPKGIAAVRQSFEELATPAH